MSWRIDSKHFNKFVVGFGLVAAFLIAASSIYLHHSAKVTFFKEVKKQQSGIYQSYFTDLFDRDSVEVSTYRGRFAVICIWSTFSGPSKALLKDLSKLKKKYPQNLMVLAADVREDSAVVKNYVKNWNYPFRFVSGDKMFFSLNVPGIPTMIAFRPDGKLLYIQAGYRDSSALDNLRDALSGS